MHVTPEAQNPNIVYILADDMGYGDVGCYGATKISTPNMDRIAAEGVRFTDAHSSSAVCTPSRYSILTGRYCWRTSLKNWVLPGYGAPIIEPKRETVASFLKRHSYATAAFGKWHLGINWATPSGKPIPSPRGFEYWSEDGFDVDYTRPLTGGPVDLGFDTWFGISGSLDMPPYCFIEDRHTVGIPDREKEHYYNQQRKGMQTPGWKDEDVDIAFARKAVAFIENHTQSNPGQPFFLYLPTASPHRPCDIQPDIVKGKSQAGDRGDMVMLFDWVVGQVTDALDRLGLTDNTLLIITSDNGARATCANGLDYGHRSCGDWRGQKADIWEGGHREPFIVRWPKRVTEGMRCDATICLGDFFATVAELLNADLPENAAEDSFSFLPALIGDEQQTPCRETVVHHSGGGYFSLRKGRWKLITLLGSGGFTQPRAEELQPGGPQGQLYDLEADPQEQQNLWLGRRDIVSVLNAELDDIVSRGRSRP